MLRLALKGVLAHKVRLAMTAVAIVLGVAFVSGTYVFTDSIKASFGDLFGDVNSGVDLYVSGVSEFGLSTPLIDEGLVDQVAALPGVVIAAPSVEGIAQIIAPPPCEKGPDADLTKPCPIGGNGPPTLGFSYFPNGEDLTPLAVSEGDWPRAVDDVVIDSFAAEANDLVVGQTVDIITPVGVEPFRISGIATFGEADNLMGATLAVFDFETAQRIFEAEGQVHQIAIVLDPSADATLVQIQVADLLPANAEVITGEDQTEADLEEVNEGLGFINTLLLVIAGVAVFVGAFLIQNTFRIIVAQRTRELALLRAVGATVRQVTVMVVIESLLVGLVASIIGIGAGILIALVLKSAFAAFGLSIPTNALVVAPRTIVVGMIVGVGVTMVAALVPTRRAAKVPPVAAMRTIETVPRSLGRRIGAGAAVTGVGLVMLTAGLVLSFDNAISVVGFGALITFVGVSLLAPLVARAFAQWAGAPLTPRPGREACQGQRNAPTASNRFDCLSAHDRSRTGHRDCGVFGFRKVGGGVGAPQHVFDGLSGANRGLCRSPRYRTPARIDRGVARCPSCRWWSVTAWATSASMRILRSSLFLPSTGRTRRSSPSRWRRGRWTTLGPDRAVLSRPAAERLDVGLGDTINIQFPSLEFAALEVVGVFDDETVGVPLIIDYTTFEDYIDFRLDRFLYLKVADGVDLESARTAITVVTDGYPNAALTDTEELIGDFEAQIDGLLNLLVVLLGFAILIALLGIVNTLALSVAERKHEIGLLRAVGMSRKQVRRMIRWEAVLIAVFGGVLGLVVGVVLGSAVVLAVGQGLELTLPFGQLVTYLVVAAIGGVIAAIVPRPPRRQTRHPRSNRVRVVDSSDSSIVSFLAGA